MCIRVIFAKVSMMSLRAVLRQWFATRSRRSRQLPQKNIAAAVQQLELRALLSGAPTQFVDPHPEVANQFGTTITTLTNGNVVITSPNDDAGGGSAVAGTGAGAVYLFDSRTGSLISTVIGSNAGDQIGSNGVTLLTNGNFVIDSPNWNGGLGAVTWGTGISGVNGTINSTNSLVGITSGDAVGSDGVTALPSGNYVVDSSMWNNGAFTSAGAVTFGNGASGITGNIGQANSLVGTAANDQVGIGGVTPLNNGNYVVDSSSWNNTVGAVTWGSGTTGVAGRISVANSLVGSAAGDAVGLQGVTALTSGNYAVSSANWNATIGAVTWGNGTTGVDGAVNSANSLIGSTAGDQVGLGSVTALSNGNYVVASPNWSNGSAADAGAVTFVDGNIGVTGAITPSNSLVGDAANDQVGSAGVTALNNGNYVVDSPVWSNGTSVKAGAVTLGDGSLGVNGVASAANSLVGAHANDRVGIGGVTALSNGNYVVDSYTWNSPTAISAGAVTLGNGSTGVTGTITAANSLIGTTAGDNVGRGGITALTNGNYVVVSKSWHNGTVANAGAATWGNGTSGAIGAVSAANSLAGTTTNDNVGVGGVTALSNGNYVVDSYQWNNGAIASVGAATWGNGASGVSGTVSTANSLIGSQNADDVGIGGVTALSNGNYVVDSKYWNNGAVAHAGAVTFGNGMFGVSGTISAASSLVGTTTNDFVGSGGINKGVTALSNGNYVVDSDDWNNGVVTQAGAVTFGSGTIGVRGNVSAANSVVGQSPTTNFKNILTITPDSTHGTVYAAFRPPTGSDQVYLGSAATGFLSNTFQFVDPHLEVANQFGTSITVLSNGNVVITSPNDDAGGGSAAAGTGAGAVYLFNGQTGALIDSLVGSQAGDQIGSGGVTALANGNFLIDSPDWNSNRGAVTWGSGTAGVAGSINAVNSLIGSTAGDAVGLGGIRVLSSGNYVVVSPAWNSATATKVGAVTFAKGTTGVVGTITSSNSLIGSTTNDQVGLGGVTTLSNGNYVVVSADWNSNLGAVTWANGATGLSGIVSVANSLFGTTTNDQVGLGGVTALSLGSYVVDSPNWSNGVATKAGAVTFANGNTGLKGAVSTSNSLVGSTANDQVGSAGVTGLNNGNYVVDSPSWSSGGLASEGAVTFGKGTAGVTGTISEDNSLVGAHANDRVGIGGVTALTNGKYVVDSYVWSNATTVGVGAVTLGSGTAGLNGTISVANSLVGSTAGDNVGKGGVTALTNGNYVVVSKAWHNGGVANAGAATWGNGTSGALGAVSSSNSLVGTTTNDSVGVGGVSALSNGNYVVDSYQWNNGTVASVGAATWGNGTSGTSGTISTANSLIGSQKSDDVGIGGITALTNGNYVVDSKYWNNGSVAHVGAVTFGNGMVGLAGTISMTNSLVGSSTNDFVGSGGIGKGVTALSNGNYVVDSDDWNNGVVQQAGAVTVGDGTTGVSGTVSVANSMVGHFPTTNFQNILTVTPDNSHNTAYAAFRPPTGSDQVYRLLKNSTGASIEVSDYIGVVTSGAGTLDFGTAILGTPVAQTIVITNTGDAPLVVQSVTVPTGYSIVPGSGFTQNETIGPGASASFTLQLNAAPPATGNVGGTVTINSSAVTGNSFTFNVKGIVSAPITVVQQGSNTIANGTGLVNLGSTLVGTPTTQLITVTNNGTAALLVTSVTVPAGYSVINDFTTNQSINPGASTSFTLQQDATSTGTSSGVVTIVDTEHPASNPFTFNVTGTVTAPAIVVQQDSTTLSNGLSTVNLGSTSIGTAVAQVITVTNNGTSPMLVTSVSVPAGYSVINDFTTNQSIAPGASTSFTLQLGGTAVGNPTGVVTIADNDTTASPFTFNVTGVVTSISTATPVMVVHQAATTLVNNGGPIVFNSISANTAVSQVFTVTNRGNAPLVVNSVTVTAGFSVLNNAVTTQPIAPGTSATFAIQLNANVSGAPTGVVTISDNDPTASSFTFSLAVNQRPTGITLAFSGDSGNVVASNQTGAVQVGALSTKDQNSVPPQTFTYSVACPTFLNGTVAIPVFSVDGQGRLILAAGAPVGIYANLSVTSTDQGGLPVTQILPTIYVVATSTIGVPASLNVAQNTPRHQTIAQFGGQMIVVQNAPGDPTATGHRMSAGAGQTSNARVINVISYQLGAGGDNSFFTIDSSGRLQTAVALNATVKSTYVVTIISTNTITGLSTRNPYTIKVVPLLKNSIVVTPTTFTLPEASAKGTIVGKVAVSDAGQTPHFTITGGNTAGAFTINSTTGQITVSNSAALLLATNPTFNLTVQATDSGASGSATVTINLAKITLSNSNIFQNSVIGTIIGQFRTTAAGNNNSFHYSLAPGSDNDANFTIDATGHLKLNVVPNAAVKNSYTINVISTDIHGLAISKIFVLTVLGPSNVTLTNSSVAQSAAIGTVIGQFSTTGVGTGNTYRYSLVSGQDNDASFTIDATGHLKLNTVLNAAVKNSDTIDVVSTDQHGLSIIKKFTISILGPSNITLSNSSVAKSAAIGTVVGQFSTTDAGTGNTFHYALIAGKDNDAEFTIDASGQLKLSVSLQGTFKTSLTIDVVSTDQRGLSITKVFTLTILPH